MKNPELVLVLPSKKLFKKSELSSGLGFEKIFKKIKFGLCLPLEKKYLKNPRLVLVRSPKNILKIHCKVFEKTF